MENTTLIVRGPSQRNMLAEYAKTVPLNTVVQFKSEKRSTYQNNMLWALLTDVARSKPHGHVKTPEEWKFILLYLMGQEMQYMEGLDGQLFAIGYNTSRFTKRQISDYIEFIYKWGAENGVEFNETC